MPFLPGANVADGVGLSDEDALRMQPSLMRYALRLTGSHGDAEDLLQETLLRGHRRFHRWEPGTNLRAWLGTLMLNVFRTEWVKKRRRLEITASDTEADATVGPSQDSALELSRVYAALPRLSVAHRSAIQSIIDGASYEEIAATLHLPVGTVRSRLFRARSVLRSEARIG